MSDSEFFSKSDFSFSDNFTDIRMVYSSVKGHTEVFSARKALKRFALKALKHGRRDDPFYVGMLRKEFELGFRLEHPSIIRTYSFEEVAGLGPCIVLEWIDGETLESHIENQTLDEKSWRKAVAELCDALEYLEKHQIVHRDIKPSNVMLTSDGYHVKLIDFGFADSPEYGTLKVNGGTLGYTAPEQLSDSKISSTADIYAMGKILEVLPIPKNRKYRDLVSRLTSENSAARPQRAGEIKAEWNKIQGGRLIGKPVIAATLAVFAIVAVVLVVTRQSEETTPVQINKKNAEIKEKSLDSTMQGNQAVERVATIVTPETAEPKKHISTPSEETKTHSPETIAPSVEKKDKRIVHWMVLLTAQMTRGTSGKLRESGDSLWELHTRQEVEEWVDSQTEYDSELRKDCHEEITRVIEKVKNGE